MASVIISISKNSPEDELKEILKSLNPEKCESPSIESQKSDRDKLFSDVITCLPQILAGSQEQIFEKFTLIGYFFAKHPELLELLSFLETFTGQTESLYALSFLYDLNPVPYHRFCIFRSICRQARKTESSLALIQPHLLKIEEYIRSWGDIDAKELNGFLQELLDFSISNQIKSRFIFRILSSDFAEPEEVDRLIGKLFSVAEQVDLQKISAFSSFSKTSQVVKELVSLIEHKSVKDVSGFVNTHKEQLVAKNFDPVKVIEVCRMNELAKITQSVGKIGMAEIAEKLSIEVADIDYWVVRSISSGTIRGKIDSINQVVYLEHDRQVKDKNAALKLLERFE